MSFYLTLCKARLRLILTTAWWTCNKEEVLDSCRHVLALGEECGSRRQEPRQRWPTLSCGKISCGKISCGVDPVPLPQLDTTLICRISPSKPMRSFQLSSWEWILTFLAFLKVSHKDTCLPHDIFSHELWVEMTAQAKLCPAIAALKTSGFWLGFEKNWIFLEVGDHDLNVDQGDEDVEAVRGQYRRVVFEKLILMTIYWWWWWCWPMKVYKECRWRQQLWRYCVTCCVDP